jgi:hypothetical protein
MIVGTGTCRPRAARIDIKMPKGSNSCLLRDITKEPPTTTSYCDLNTCDDIADVRPQSHSLSSKFLVLAAMSAVT